MLHIIVPFFDIFKSDFSSSLPPTEMNSSLYRLDGITIYFWHLLHNIHTEMYKKSDICCNDDVNTPAVMG